jgi:hypothetical protein
MIDLHFECMIPLVLLAVFLQADHMGKGSKAKSKAATHGQSPQQVDRTTASPATTPTRKGRGNNKKRKAAPAEDVVAAAAAPHGEEGGPSVSTKGTRGPKLVIRRFPANCKPTNQVHKSGALCMRLAHYSHRVMCCRHVPL